MHSRVRIWHYLHGQCNRRFTVVSDAREKAHSAATVVVDMVPVAVVVDNLQQSNKE